MLPLEDDDLVEEEAIEASRIGDLELTGLRNISISYSRISLADVAKKLRLESPNPMADAESIVSKAIRNGAIDATLDHPNGWMVSKETGDIYSTNEPQLAFNSRIAFYLNMHNEAESEEIEVGSTGGGGWRK
uniref:Probable 26S proteasome non-ATPase regulatory subunit 3 n=1 Tax=Tanacetum cinerariifolium TaxID=118510 RepID=A0A6L2J5A6_TANCI|nr:probable 26S proteasome non-ATPase regulatory subunit 3 [Tanacetum cinerariifolium]